MGYDRRRRQPPEDVQAAGCLIALTLFGFLFFFKALYELTRYRPQPYRPIAPDTSREIYPIHITATHKELVLALLALGALLATSYAVHVMPYLAFPDVFVPTLGSIVLGIFSGWYARRPAVVLGGMAVISLALTGWFVREYVWDSCGQYCAPDRAALVSALGGIVFVGLALWSIPSLSNSVGLPPLPRRKRLVEKSKNTPFMPPIPTTYTIYPTRGKADYVMGVNLMQSLLATCPRLTFQIVAEPGRTRWQVLDMESQYRASQITTTIRSHAPETLVVTDEPETRVNRTWIPFYRKHLMFGLTNEFAAPLPFLEHLKTNDPLIPITRQMDFVQESEHERITYGLSVWMQSPVAKRRASERLKEGDIWPLSDLLSDTEDDRLHGLNERFVAMKLDGPLYHAFLVVTLESIERDRLKELAQIATSVVQFHLPQHNRLRLVHSSSAYDIAEPEDDLFLSFEALLQLDVAAKKIKWREALLVVHPSELAALWHLPHEDFSAEQIAWAGPKVPAKLTEAGEERVRLGITVSPGLKQPVFLRTLDRAYHHYITGKTGMGKSTLLHNLIHQDIAAGRGVAVIDPHGKLIDDILAASIPPKRVNDVVILECGRSEYPVPLNPFRIPKGVSFDEAFNLIYWVVQKIYDGVWRQGRMDVVFRQVVQALLTDPQATPLDIQRVLLDKPYRTRLISQMREGGTTLSQVGFWEWYEAQSRSEQMEIAAPILNRTGAFLGSRALEHITCHPQTLSFRDLIGHKRIVLVNLSGQSIHAEAGSLGAIFLANFYLSMQSFGYLPSGAPPRFYLYVDEVERMVSAPLPDMFAQARKFGLSLTLANQYLDQLSDDALTGILGNVGTLLVFEMGERDSKRLLSQFDPELSRTELLKLGAYRMAVRTRCLGETMPPFRVATPVPPQREQRPPLDRIRAHTIAEYLPLTVQEVRAFLNTRYGTVAAPPNTPKPTSTDGLTDYD